MLVKKDGLAFHKKVMSDTYVPLMRVGGHGTHCGPEIMDNLIKCRNRNVKME